MEQKKILWIVAAVGLFLCVVIGAAMILYSTPGNSTPAVAAVTPIVQPNQMDYQTVSTISDTLSDQQLQNTVPPVAVTQPQPTTVDQMTVISGTTNVYGFTNTSENNSTGLAVQPTTTTIDLNTLKSVPQTEVTVTPNNEYSSKEIAQASVQKNTYNKPSTTTASTVKKPAQKTQAPAAKKQNAAPKVASPTQAPLTPKYWVQAVSVTSKKSADNARSVLDENRISSEVFTYKDAKGQVFYRVRVGPYTTKSEAEYWKTRIMEIPEFASSQSYVTNSSAPKNS
ncbi:MAG: SPOR domain-containing protein [Treponema sp.]|nr:SPOR domain-containing protein [Treponema sp.]